jgi:Protein of unknwon function (DUF3310)
MAKKKLNKSTRVRELLAKEQYTAAVIAKKVGCTVALVRQIHKKMRAESDKKVEDAYLEKVSDNPVPEFLKPDPINPDHYKQHGIETIDYIEACDLNYRLGNVIKYVSRAGLKGSYLEDLKKARWYLDREISKHE